MRALTIFLAVILSWCAAAAADVPRVVTDIAPLHSLVSQVMQGAGEPEILIQADASPHDFQLRPSQAAHLAAADLIIWMGPALSPWLERSITTIASSAQSLVLMDKLEVEYRARPRFSRQRAEPDRDHSDHSDHGGDHDHDHDHDGLDPHAWLDPQNASQWLTVIADALGAADPDNAGLYRRNALAAQSELSALDTRIARQLAPVQPLAYMVAHDAYQYFERRYGLHPKGAVSQSDAASPGAATLVAIRSQLEETAVRCIFLEPQMDPKQIRVITEGLDIEQGLLDPLGVGIPLGPQHYGMTLQGLADGYSRCLDPARR